jgi:hypothetical protein
MRMHTRRFIFLCKRRSEYAPETKADMKVPAHRLTANFGSEPWFGSIPGPRNHAWSAY